MTLNQLFIVGAIVLAVLAIIASASSSFMSLGVNWDTWVSASLLSFFASLFLGPLNIGWPRKQQ